MTHQALIRFIPADRMPGALRKTLDVPQGHFALLVEGDRVVGRRDPGPHRIGNWPRPAPDAVLLPQGPFDLRPRIRRLRSGDGQDLDLLWPLTLELRDPARFYSAWLASAAGPDLALVDLEDQIAGRLWEQAAKQVQQYELADLRLEEQLQAGLARALTPSLASLLSDLGLALTGSRLPQPRTLEEERDLLGMLSLAERAARDERFEALFERLEDREMLEHRLAEWAAERGQPPPDAALVERLWQVVETGPAETAARAQRAAALLDEEVKALQRTLETVRSENERRFHQLQARLESAEKTVAEIKGERDIPWLKNLANITGAVGAVLTVVTAFLAYFAPHLAEPYETLQLVSGIVAGVSGAATVLSRVLFQKQIRRRQEQAQLDKIEAGRAGLLQRRAADRLVRARVEAGLKQAASSLEAAWRKGFAAGGPARDLAVDLRLVARQVQGFEERDVRAANYLAGRYLARDPVPDAELGAVLNLDDDLLARSQALAKSAEALYEQVNAGQVDTARSSMRDLENGLNALRNRFIERGAYLMG